MAIAGSERRFLGRLGLSVCPRERNLAFPPQSNGCWYMLPSSTAWRLSAHSWSEEVTDFQF